MITIKEEGSRPIHLWVKHENSHFKMSGTDRTDIDIEASALQQLKNIAQLPFIHRHGVAAMPDVHFGIGATVGSVIATQKAIIPAAVGVDIGCGMMAVRLAGATKDDLPDSLAEMRHDIERAVPSGFHQHKPGFWNTTVASLFNHAAGEALGKHICELQRRRKDHLDTVIASQLGTLGGGNHFIELCIDELGELWVMLHSGSRGIGNTIGSYFIELAKEDMRKHFINLPDKDLAYFPEGTEHFADYVKAVNWAQSYARANRDEMMRVILATLRRYLPAFRADDLAINCHHNYVSQENHFGDNVYLTRKGAIRARAGDLGIIPGSMGTRSYIVRGLGNADSYHSCSHGAGRRMGRKEAGKRFTLADLEAQTAGVECRKDNAVLDEIPGAYKDIDVVMANQRDLVEVVHTLKQVLCVKGD